MRRWWNNTGLIIQGNIGRKELNRDDFDVSGVENSGSVYNSYTNLKYPKITQIRDIEEETI